MMLVGLPGQTAMLNGVGGKIPAMGRSRTGIATKEQKNRYHRSRFSFE
jgi:hypothetical protein